MIFCCHRIIYLDEILRCRWVFLGLVVPCEGLNFSLSKLTLLLSAVLWQQLVNAALYFNPFPLFILSLHQMRKKWRWRSLMILKMNLYFSSSLHKPDSTIQFPQLHHYHHHHHHLYYTLFPFLVSSWSKSSLLSFFLLSTEPGDERQRKDR